ncbi:hypothetical protein PAGU2595_014940 [Lysobacter xanthus]
MLVAALVGGWKTLGPRPHHPAPSPAAGPVACPRPAAVRAFAEPLQSSLTSDVGPFRLRAATLRPLAGFSVDARVLSRQDYDSGREADLSPTDLALGWGRMREDAVLDHLDISQGGRWYRYRWSGDPPIPPGEIVRSSANMHLIPGDESVARALDSVREGDRVRFDGWLVAAEAPDGWTWRSSTSREDTGDGACEVIYVCSLTRF